MSRFRSGKKGVAVAAFALRDERRPWRPANTDQS